MLRKSNYLSNRTTQGGVGWALEDLFLTHGRGTELEGLTGLKIPSLIEKKKRLGVIVGTIGNAGKKKKGGMKDFNIYSDRGSDRSSDRGGREEEVKDRDRDRNRDRDRDKDKNREKQRDNEKGKGKGRERERERKEEADTGVDGGGLSFGGEEG